MIILQRFSRVNMVRIFVAIFSFALILNVKPALAAEDDDPAWYDIGGWLKEAFEAVLNFFGSLWSHFCDFFLSIIKWFVEIIKWVAETIVNFLYYIFDSFISLLYDIVVWMIDLLPELSLPGEFNSGLRSVIDYGMLFNEIVPVTHMLICLSIYLTAFLIVGIVRLVIRFIPFIAG